MPTDAMARPTALTLGPNSSFSASPRSMPRSPLDRSRTSPLRSSSLRSEISSDDDEEEEATSSTSSTDSNDSNDSTESEPERERRPFSLPQRNRVRFTPLTPAHPPSGMAKSQPLARALLNRALTPNNAQPKKTTKIIVPTKSFRTTFELGLTSNELARK